MKRRSYQAAVRLRGDALYCPLPVSLLPYWTCEAECAHCYARQLNRTWGQDFRAADPEAIIKRLSTARGSSHLSEALRQRKTIRMGGRSDPFQPAEVKHRVSSQILDWLREQDWEVVIQTKYPERAAELNDLGPNVILMPEITVGLVDDWELFERGRTENPLKRLYVLSQLKRDGVRVAVNGEPFIPGYHTVQQFEDTLRLLKEYGINRYNVYNLHLNDLVAKNLADLDLDIERIWRMNQDRPWRKILRQLLEVAQRHDFILGCPDFVNSGWEYRQRPNTCCGVDVCNPCTWNTHHFKLAIQDGRNPMECWDSVGDYDQGCRILDGTLTEMYTMNDVK